MALVFIFKGIMMMTTVVVVVVMMVIMIIIIIIITLLISIIYMWHDQRIFKPSPPTDLFFVVISGRA